MSQATEAKVIEVASKQFAKPKETISRSTSFEKDLGGDSLDAVEFIMEIEDAFGIEISESAAEKMKTVGDVADYVEKAPKKA